MIVSEKGCRKNLANNGDIDARGLALIKTKLKCWFYNVTSIVDNFDRFQIFAFL